MRYRSQQKFHVHVLLVRAACTSFCDTMYVLKCRLSEFPVLKKMKVWNLSWRILGVYVCVCVSKMIQDTKWHCLCIQNCDCIRSLCSSQFTLALRNVLDIFVLCVCVCGWVAGRQCKMCQIISCGWRVGFVHKQSREKELEQTLIDKPRFSSRNALLCAVPYELPDKAACCIYKLPTVRCTFNRSVVLLGMPSWFSALFIIILWCAFAY